MAWICLEILFYSFIGICIYIIYKKHVIPMHNAFKKEDFEIFDRYKRFIVVGCSCSGKSTLAHQICQKYPWLSRIELDYLWWKPHWNCRTKEEFRALVGNKIKESKNGWIVDGNYGKGKDIIWSEAECVIWLEYEFWEVFYRACKRTLIRMITRQEVCNGNKETICEFFKDLKVRMNQINQLKLSMDLCVIYRMRYQFMYGDHIKDSNGSYQNG